MNDAQPLLAAVAELAPLIATRADEFEASRRIPQDFVERLRDAGLFRLAAPHQVGGTELDLGSRMQVLEALARADASVAWTVSIAVDITIILSRLGQANFLALYEKGPSTVLAGSLTPAGTAEIIDGGYLVSGRWPWASGALHAEWFFGHCRVTSNGAPVEGPAPGIPATVIVVLTRAQVEILDTWNPVGLCGTGSHDFEVRDQIVSEDWGLQFPAGAPCLPGPVYHEMTIQGGLDLAAIAAGIARGALDDVTALATGGKQRVFAPSKMASSHLFQFHLGHAELDLQATGAALRERARAYTDGADGIAPGLGSLTDPLAVELRAAAVWAIQKSASVVDAAYHAAGGSAVARSASLQRRFRDIHTLTQHVGASDAWITAYGAALTGAG